MSNELRDTIAQAVRSEVCCQNSSDAAYWYFEDETLNSIADAVLAALQTGGWELVKHPEPEKFVADGIYNADRFGESTDVYPGDGGFYDDAGRWFTPETARNAAAVLLGAAAAAERGVS